MTGKIRRRNLLEEREQDFHIDLAKKPKVFNTFRDKWCRSKFGTI